jgi:hypothetical protein
MSEEIVFLDEVSSKLKPIKPDQLSLDNNQFPEETHSKMPIESDIPNPSYYNPEWFNGPLNQPHVPSVNNNYRLSNNFIPNNTTPTSEAFLLEKINNMNCRDIDKHIKSCSVCSQLHKSYAFAFIGVIIGLIIICAFLGRKFFE